MKLNIIDILKYIRKYFYLCVGLFIYAFAFNLFMIPNDFVVGGVSGISIIINKFFNIDTSLTISVFSTFLLIIGIIFCNKNRIYSSVVSTFVLPVFIKLTSNITSYINLDLPLLISCLYCAILVGVALGLVYKVGFSTGGTEILYWIFEKYIKKSTGQLMFIIEGIIVLTGAFVFGFEKLMYSLIILYLMSNISDKIVIGISEFKLVCVIPYKVQDVSDYINSLSFIKSFNIISENGKEVIYCVVATKDYNLVCGNIKNIDKKAFISACNSYETIGGLEYE